MKLFNIRWDVQTAGPSPDTNKRVEIYFAGCRKAMEGNPCPNCFNQPLWNMEHGKTTTPKEVVDWIDKFYPKSRYVSICGGEPLDQFNDLTELCRLLKEKKDRHILLYTHYLYEDLLLKDKQSHKLFPYVDILIDGTYDEDKRIYKEESPDGFYGSVGSWNQRVIDLKRNLTVAGLYIKGLTLNTNNELTYHLNSGQTL